MSKRWKKGNPKVAGVYQTRGRGNKEQQEITFQYWSGFYWSRTMSTDWEAFQRRSDPSLFQNNDWRTVT